VGKTGPVSISHSAVEPSASTQAARALSQALEPFVGCVYFAPDCHEAYAGLGFSPSTRQVNGVAMPDGIAYFTSRGSLLGQVHGNLVASAFAVFNPAAVVPAVAHGWTITDAATIRMTRQESTVSFIRRSLDRSERAESINDVADALARAVAHCPIEGRPLYAGVMSEETPSDPLARAWFLGDALREARGDSHTAAWINAGLDAVEIGLLTEAFWGLPFKSYVRTRAWSDEQLDNGLARLAERGLVDNGAMTEAGKQLRNQIELDTDFQMVRAITGVGENIETVIATLARWSASIRAAHGYPGAGPQDLVNARNSS
jgi:hypothetical protein